MCNKPSLLAVTHSQPSHAVMYGAQGIYLKIRLSHVKGTIYNVTTYDNEKTLHNS